MELLETTSKSAVFLKNVLFATDYSEASNAALPYAMAICHRYESNLCVTHVVPKMSFPAAAGTLEPIPIEPIYAAAGRDAEEQMKRLEVYLAGVPRRTYVRHGDVWEILSQIIREDKIDLLVIGTHGRTGLGKLLVGSVAEEIFRQAPCPVLTVGPKVSGRAKLPLLTGKGGNPAPVDIELRTILYATDLKPGSHAAATFAISLAQEFGARLSLMHVIEEFGDLHHRPGPIEMALRKLEELVPEEAGLWCSPVPVVKFGSPADCILQTADESRVDLIVLGVRSENGQIGTATHLPWATAHQVVARARCPVLTVRG